jgi:hypothetical protein
LLRLNAPGNAHRSTTGAENIAGKKRKVTEDEKLRQENLGLKRKLEETKVREIDLVLSDCITNAITYIHTGDTSVGVGRERQSTKGSRRTEGRKCPRGDGDESQAVFNRHGSF